MVLVWLCFCLCRVHLTPWGLVVRAALVPLTLLVPPTWMRSLPSGTRCGCWCCITCVWRSEFSTLLSARPQLPVVLFTVMPTVSTCIHI